MSILEVCCASNRSVCIHYTIWILTIKIKVMTGYLHQPLLMSNLECNGNKDVMTTDEYDKMYVLNQRTLGIVGCYKYVVYYYHNKKLRDITKDLVNTNVEEIEVKSLFLLAFK